jgi:hypothetical protein
MLQFIESLLAIRGPGPLDILLKELVEWMSGNGESFNESSIVGA